MVEQDRIEDGEGRWQTIGLVGGLAVLLIAHAVREKGTDEIIRLISAGGPGGRSGRAMRKIVRKAPTGHKLTTRQKRELTKLAAQPDSEIDYSDIPPLSEKFWKNAVRNPFYRPVKEQVTLRIDADILAWLRQQGKGYQSRLNSLLRSAMLERLGDKEKSA